MDTWRWAAARSIGTSHIANGSSCEDAVLVRQIQTDNGNVLIATVADGAGSAGRGGVGSRIITQSIAGHAANYAKQNPESLPGDELIWDWIDAARDCVSLRASKEGRTPREFAATLVFTYLTSGSSLLVHVGDGAAVIDFGDGWEVPSWPATGEYASTTYFVTDDPGPKVSIIRVDRPARSVAVFSDGIERLALRFADQTAHEPFFRHLFAFFDKTDARGRDRIVSRKLRKFLDSALVNDRTDDDKTLVLANRL